MPPGCAGKKVNIASAVEDGWIIVTHLQRTKHVHCRLIPSGFYKPLQPIKRRKGIGIEQRDEFGFLVDEAQIICGCKTNVPLQLSNAEPWITGKPCKRVVSRGVVNNERFEVRIGLLDKSLKATGEMRARIVVDDNHAHKFDAGTCREVTVPELLVNR